MLSSEILGWIGSLLIVIAYLLVSLNKVESSSKFYQLLNLFGAIGVGVNVFFQHAWPALALQIVWGIVAVFALAKGRRSSR